MEAALSHRPVAEAMASGQPERAVAAMDLHLKTTWHQVPRTIAARAPDIAATKMRQLA